MSRLATVIRPDIEPGRRVIAVSDIHGNLAYLKGLLKKVGFSRDDVLILVGDLLEKGQDSLATLRFVLDLQKEHTIYSLCGNCDDIDRMFLDWEVDEGASFARRANTRIISAAGAAEALWPVLECWGNRSVLIQMGLELGHPMPRRAADLPALRAALLDYFPRETAFLRTMPQILEAGRYIFVHGGIPREDRLDELDAYSCLKNDDFLGQGHSFQKWVAVGHWPVTLYDPSIQCSNPLVERDRHIISMDGGCVLKVDGQLNALIIPDITRDRFQFASYDGLPRAHALDGQDASYNPINIRWSDSEVLPLAENGDCLFVRHPSSGRTLWVPRDFVSRWRDGKLHTEDATDYSLPVSPGDELALVRETQRGVLAKKDGVTGWYHGRFERK